MCGLSIGESVSDNKKDFFTSWSLDKEILKLMTVMGVVLSIVGIFAFISIALLLQYHKSIWGLFLIIVLAGVWQLGVWLPHKSMRRVRSGFCTRGVRLPAKNVINAIESLLIKMNINYTKQGKQRMSWSCFVEIFECDYNICVRIESRKLKPPGSTKLAWESIVWVGKVNEENKKLIEDVKKELDKVFEVAR